MCLHLTVQHKCFQIYIGTYFATFVNLNICVCADADLPENVSFLSSLKKSFIVFFWWFNSYALYSVAQVLLHVVSKLHQHYTIIWYFNLLCLCSNTLIRIGHNNNLNPLPTYTVIYFCVDSTHYVFYKLDYNLWYAMYVCYIYLNCYCVPVYSDYKVFLFFATFLWYVNRG